MPAGGPTEGKLGAGLAGAPHLGAAHELSGGTGSLLDLSELLALEKTLIHGPTEGMLGMDLAGAAPLAGAARLERHTWGLRTDLMEVRNHLCWACLTFLHWTRFRFLLTDETSVHLSARFSTQRDINCLVSLNNHTLTGDLSHQIG